MSGGTILVTGTSSGIGRACAVDLAGRGFHMLAGVRNETDGEAIERLPERAGGALAGLVNNAGLSRPGPVE